MCCEASSSQGLQGQQQDRDRILVTQLTLQQYLIRRRSTVWLLHLLLTVESPVETDSIAAAFE